MVIFGFDFGFGLSISRSLRLFGCIAGGFGTLISSFPPHSFLSLYFHFFLHFTLFFCIFILIYRFFTFFIKYSPFRSLRTLSFLTRFPYF